MTSRKIAGVLAAAALAVLAAVGPARASSEIYTWNQDTITGVTNGSTTLATTTVTQISATQIDVKTVLSGGEFSNGGGRALTFDLGGFATGVTVTEAITASNTAGFTWTANSSATHTETTPLTASYANGTYGNFTDAIQCSGAACPGSPSSGATSLDFTLSVSSGTISYANLICNGTGGACGYYFAAQTYNNSVSTYGAIASNTRKVSEPATLALLGSFLLLFGAVRYRTGRRPQPALA